MIASILLNIANLGFSYLNLVKLTLGRMLG